VVPTTNPTRRLYDVLVEGTFTGHVKLRVSAANVASAKRRALRILAGHTVQPHDGEDHGTWHTAHRPLRFWIVTGPYELDLEDK
jgi:hypothetical protein